MKSLKLVTSKELETLLDAFGILGPVEARKTKKPTASFILRPSKAVRARDVLSLGEDLERILGLPYVRISVVKGQNAFAFDVLDRKPDAVSKLQDETSEERYRAASALVRQERKASASFLQRCLGIGYNAAAALIERMENEGIVSLADAVGKRKILM